FHIKGSGDCDGGGSPNLLTGAGGSNPPPTHACRALSNRSTFGYCQRMTGVSWPNLREGDFGLRGFRFASGGTLPELRQHYLTLGTPLTDAAGRIVNAVLLIHNTTGTAQSWLEPGLANELYGPGQPLDAARHFLIVPDIIGFGGSSKPSDGLRTR